MYRSVMCVLHYASTLELGAHFQADGPIRAPHPIIAISGLTRPLADDRYYYIVASGQKSLVSLACTRRTLKEQTLRTLRSEQQSAKTLAGWPLCRARPPSSRYPRYMY